MPVSDQGVNLERYMLIPRTLIFLTRGEHVLLIKGAAHKRLWAGKYNGLGGHVEPGEDVLRAAQRELSEEAGLTSADLHLVGTVVVDSGQNPGIVLFVFRGECPQGSPHSSHEGELEWVSRDQLPGFPLVEDLKVLLPRVLEHRPDDAPFNALYVYAQDGKLEIKFNI